MKPYNFPTPEACLAQIISTQHERKRTMALSGAEQERIARLQEEIRDIQQAAEEREHNKVGQLADVLDNLEEGAVLRFTADWGASTLYTYCAIKIKDVWWISGTANPNRWKSGIAFANFLINAHVGIIHRAMTYRVAWSQ